MDDFHKNIIELYRSHLIEHTQFDALWEKLSSYGIENFFPDYMVQDIFSTPNGCARNERLFNLIQTCDHPTAFKSLCNALSSSGQNELSLLLLDEKGVHTQVDSKVTNKYPGLPPLIKEVHLCHKPSAPLSSWGKVRKYPVKSTPRGYMLLVNMRFVMNPREDERTGSEVDVRLLKQLFTQLNYEIVEHHDLTLAGMKDALHSFSQMHQLGDVDSILVFVMSHGRSPAERTATDPPLKSPGSESVDITLEDNQVINSNDIVEYINTSPSIRPNVPRMFFFNVCRGSKIDWNGYHAEADLDSSFQDKNNVTQIDAQLLNDPPTNENNIISIEYADHTNTNGIPTNENIDHTNTNDIPTNENITISNGNTAHSNPNDIPTFENNTISNGNTVQNNTNNIPTFENNITANGNIVQNNTNDIPAFEGNISSNGTNNQTHDKGALLQSNGAHQNGLSPIDSGASNVNADQRSLCCCFFSLSGVNKDKRRNRLVRLAFWFSKTFKCSMPSTDHEDPDNAAFSTNPSGVSKQTETQDSPDSEVPHDVLWRPSEAEVNPEIQRSASKASKTSSQHSQSGFRQVMHAMNPSHMIERLSHTIRPERRVELTGDIFIAFSTVDGYNSKRHPMRGSWFVTTICEVFAESAKDTDLVSMMEDVESRLRMRFDQSYGTQMNVVKKEGFSKKFYFNVEQETG